MGTGDCVQRHAHPNLVDARVVSNEQCGGLSCRPETGSHVVHSSSSRTRFSYSVLRIAASSTLPCIPFLFHRESLQSPPSLTRAYHGASCDAHRQKVRSCPSKAMSTSSMLSTTTPLALPPAHLQHSHPHPICCARRPALRRAVAQSEHRPMQIMPRTPS